VLLDVQCRLRRARTGRDLRPRLPRTGEMRAAKREWTAASDPPNEIPKARRKTGRPTTTEGSVDPKSEVVESLGGGCRFVTRLQPGARPCGSKISHGLDHEHADGGAGVLVSDGFLLEGRGLAVLGHPGLVFSSASSVPLAAAESVAPKVSRVSAAPSRVVATGSITSRMACPPTSPSILRSRCRMPARTRQLPSHPWRWRAPAPCHRA
jgi:hypothetical protein